MKILELKINYYKNIKKPLKLIGLPISILIGQNNCGKSNILYAIDYVFNKKNVSQSLAYPKADIAVSLEFSVEEKRQLRLPGFKAVLKLKNNQRRLVFSAKGGSASRSGSETLQGRMTGGKQKTIKYQGRLATTLAKKIKHLTSRDYHNLAQIKKDWQSLSNYPDSLQQFKKSLAKHFPQIVTGRNALDINYDQTDLKEGERKVTIDRLGSGFRRVFIILLYIFHPEYPVVIIDEPETHLHPGLVKKLLWAIQNSQGGQIFFTTHSPLFIKPITLPQVIRVVKTEASTESYGLSLVDKRFPQKRLLQELNADNLEMFFAETVILVEGVSDRILMRGLIDKFYQGDKEIKVVQTHGKGNLALYLNLLKVFKIDFIIMLDRDALGWQLDNVLNYLNIKPQTHEPGKLIRELKKYKIFILPKGSIEQHYPRYYQKDKRKPLNALQAAIGLNSQEFNSNLMRPLREIINSL